MERGPANACPHILSTLVRPTIGHLDPRFIDMIEELKELAQKAFRDDNSIAASTVLRQVRLSQRSVVYKLRYSSRLAGLDY